MHKIQAWTRLQLEASAPARDRPAGPGRRSPSRQPARSHRPTATGSNRLGVPPGSESSAGRLPRPAHERSRRGPSRPPARARCRRQPTAAIEAGSESSSGPGPLPPPAHGGDRGGVRVVLRPVSGTSSLRWSGAGSLAWPQASRRACCARHPGRLLLDPVRTTISIFKVISLSPLLSFLSFLLFILLFLHSLRLLTPRSSPCLRPRFFLLYPAP